MTTIEWRTYVGMLLSDERVRGDIILTAISFEASLDSFLKGYFAYWPKREEFERIVLSRLSMSQKIDIFRNLHFRSSLKSFPELVGILQGMNRLRNHAAHAWWGDGERVLKLADNEFVRRFLSKYPRSSTTTAYRLRRLFAALEKAKEYRATDMPDDDIPF